MKVYYDCEFWENGHTIDLISIGLVAEDGREYYAVNADCDWFSIIHHAWLKENVVPYLPTKQDRHWLRLDVDNPTVKLKLDIAKEVREFLQCTPDLEMWAWYGAYDHVALCQLWGRMIDLPSGIPMWTNDIRQEFHRLGNPSKPTQDLKEHHALDDARFNMQLHKFVLDYERAQKKN